jgi:hypothetical protein
VARRDVGRPGKHEGPPDAGAAGSCGSRRDAEVRIHRRPRRARTGFGAGDGGSGRRGSGRQEAAVGPRRRDHLPRHPDGLGAGLRRSGAADTGAARPRRRQRGSLLRHRSRRGDDRPDQGRCQGRRFTRWRRRGARLRRAGGPRQSRALGPQARRAAGRRGDEHPGGQGRRDRRRLRGRRTPRQRRPRSDLLGRRGRCLPSWQHPRRWHRGRNVDRRAGGGAGGDETVGHAQPADPGDRRHGDQGVGPVVQGAHRRHRRAGDGGRRRDDGRPGPRRGGAAFGGDSVDEFVRNADAFAASLS